MRNNQLSASAHCHQNFSISRPRQLLIKSILHSAYLSLALLSVLLSYSSPAAAHFHYDVDVKTTLLFDTQQRLIGLKQVWLYDENVSEIMLEENTDLSAFSEAMIRDLETLSFFTTLSVDGKAVAYAKPDSYSLKKRGQTDNPRLELQFTLPFTQPINLAGTHHFRLEHTDPTGSAQLRYHTMKDLNLGSRLAAACQLTLVNKQQVNHGESVQDIHWQCHLPG